MRVLKCTGSIMGGGVSPRLVICVLSMYMHGKYLAWVDPDDTVEPDFLYRVISLMENEWAD